MLAIALLCMGLTPSTDLPPPPSPLAPEAGDAVLDDDAPSAEDGSDTEAHAEEAPPSTSEEGAEMQGDGPLEADPPPAQGPNATPSETHAPEPQDPATPAPSTSDDPDPDMERASALRLLGWSVGGALATGAIPVAATAGLALLNAVAYGLVSTAVTNPGPQPGLPYLLLPQLLVAPIVSVVAGALVFVGSVGTMAIAAWFLDAPWLSSVLWQAAGALGAALLVAGAGMTPFFAFALLAGFAVAASSIWPDASERESAQLLSVALLTITFVQVGWWAACATTALGAVSGGALLGVGGLDVVLPAEE